MPADFLPERGILRVGGEDAFAFLDAILSGNLAGAARGEASYAALLSPQGKILYDMIVIGAPAEDGGGFLLDLPRLLAPDTLRRLELYRLRSRVELADLSEGAAVTAAWDDERPDELPAMGEDALVVRDPRRPELGWRVLHARAAPPAGVAGEPWGERYHARRVALGVPEIVRDYATNTTFPHEALLDRLGGVDFAKGCYVGQEIVSRMEHRGTARTRFVRLRYLDGFPAEADAPVLAGEGADAVSLGETGSGARPYGLARLRLDRLADAVAARRPLTAGGLPVAVDAVKWSPADPPEKPAPVLV